MSVFLLRILEHVHGHLGWLSAAALLHPAIILRNPKRRAWLSASLATALVTVSGVLGGLLYPEYRSSLRQELFVRAPTVGWLFERKEHLAVGVIGFAWIGCIAHLTAKRFDERLDQTVSRIAHRAFVISLVFCVVVACLGVVVATRSTF